MLVIMKKIRQKIMEEKKKGRNGSMFDLKKKKKLYFTINNKIIVHENITKDQYTLIKSRLILKIFIKIAV